jgi:hypothetical protein
MKHLTVSSVQHDREILMAPSDGLLIHKDGLQTVEGRFG